MKLPTGTRVFAILSATDDEVAMLGRGVYVGDEVPPPEVTFLGESMTELGLTNPKIVLDDGRVVWGCQCWWGPESRVDEMVAGRRVTDAEIPPDMYATEDGATA